MRAPGRLRTVSTLTELAARIDVHLKRLEADPATNVLVKSTHRFFHAKAYATSRHVAVTYVSFQGESKLTKAEATAYLAALDDGFAKQHYALGAPPGPAAKS